MLEIASISWKNFLSFGDYITTLDLSNRGQCLVTGEIIDDDIRESYDNDTSVNDGLKKNKRSNGAGKSSVVSVIQWALFGRTMHSASPGDAVVNWYTGKDCWAKITFKNGDSITRTRNTHGANELLFTHDGDEHKLISDTISTSKNQQNILAKTFKLDWELFCGSAFFSQYGKPWMEMSDQVRKRALERLLHADRMTYYSRSSKTKIDVIDQSIIKMNLSKSSYEATILRLKTEAERLTISIDNFSDNIKKRHDEAVAMADIEISKRDAIEVPDIDKLKLKWSIVEKIREKIKADKSAVNEIDSEISIIDRNINNCESKLESIKSKIKTWSDKKGKICTSCEQSIDLEHVENRIAPYIKSADTLNENLKTHNDSLKALENKRSALKSIIQKSENLLSSSLPKVTLQTAYELISRRDSHNNEFNRLIKLSESILKESNPHISTLADINHKLQECNSKLLDIVADIERQNKLNKHYQYVYKAYTDRTKIKSFAFQDHIPFINNRLRHYLDVFGLDIKIELTDSLSISSNLWGYDFESGGERKKTDVAMMLATFDFHEYMYGRQCNILALDEVDGRLDDDGIEALINVIKTDLADRVETLFIISHKNTMRDVFPNEIRVKRVNRFSYLEST